MAVIHLYKYHYHPDLLLRSKHKHESPRRAAGTGAVVDRLCCLGLPTQRRCSARTRSRSQQRERRQHCKRHAADSSPPHQQQHIPSLPACLPERRKRCACTVAVPLLYHSCVSLVILLVRDIVHLQPLADKEWDGERDAVERDVEQSFSSL